MKRSIKFFMPAVLCMFTLGLYAQDVQKEKTDPEKKPVEANGYEPPRTLIKPGALRFSGYGAPEVQLCYIDDQVRVFTGGRGGLIINDQFVIGGAGYGMTSSLSTTIDGEPKRVRLGYGGLLLEWYFFPKSLIHISAGTLIGAGGVGAFRHGSHSEDDMADDCFVLQPEINLFINLTKYCRVGIGGNYRFVEGLDKSGLSDNVYRRFSATIMVQFGKF